ncbi:MAG: chitobiase/beta-hexosaminidase C-terminal domain-containing protein, partial [Paludibacteraceae bacterium]|nr:chitobiase/beta-hexosaminidase C-terminal domain-containing protein [Paludibacteraceae bacterium]
YVTAFTISTVITGINYFMTLNPVAKNMRRLASFAIGLVTEYVDNIAKDNFSNGQCLSTSYMLKRGNDKARLKCHKKDDDKPNDSDNNDDDKKKDKRWRPYRGEKPPTLIDPSGFVYEGIEDNRVEGVKATVYYKSSHENMFGEMVEEDILWDAENYGQENPLYTDAQGMYRWDVPQGLWQVRFEKEGYEPTQSEWLPVPPPQLEVNIPIVQLRQPEVANAIAHKDAIDITFDKYMMPSLLNTGNIFVTANDQTIAGTIVMLDEQHPYNDNAISYASKVRFVPAAPFTASEITLTVSTRVHSYADVPLAQTFQQTFDVEDATVIEPAQSPVASIASGTVVALGTQLTLSCATEGAVIRYTVDGSDPDCKTGYVYSAPIVLYGNGSVTVKAIACADGFDPSEVATFTYVISTDTHISACGTDGHAHVYVKGGILHVEGLTSPAQVYSAQGMLLMTVTNGTYRLPAGGMYLIRHDKGVKKIVF